MSFMDKGGAASVAPSSLSCDGWLFSAEHAGTMDDQFSSGLVPIAPQRIPETNKAVEFLFGKHMDKEAATARTITVDGLSMSIQGAELESSLSFREKAMEAAGYLVVRDESDVYNPCDQIDIATEVAFNAACSSSPEDVMRRYAEVLFAGGLAEDIGDDELQSMCEEQLDALDAFDNTDIAVEWQRRPYRGSIGQFGEAGTYYGDEQGWRYEDV